MVQQLRRQIALGRPGTPDEAAGGIVLLCLPQSDYVTGQILRIDGGLANEHAQCVHFGASTATNVDVSVAYAKSAASNCFSMRATEARATLE